MKLKLLSVFLVLIMLLSAFAACTQPPTEDTSSDTAEESEETNIDLTYTEENATLLSGENHYRIVYSSDVSALTVQNVRNRLNVLDEAEGVNYQAFLDTEVEEDGTPEILIGLTNRALSTEAKGMIESALDYAIILSDNKIAIFALTPAGITKAITEFRSKLVVNEIGQVFYSETENFLKKVTQFESGTLTIDDASIKNFSIVVPKDADTDTLTAADKIATLFMEKTGAVITVRDDSTPEAENEILIGNTNRAESAALTEDPIDVSGDYRVLIDNQKLAAVANGMSGYNSLFVYLTEIIASKAITSEHSIDTLSLAEIEAITFGAVYLDKAKDGVYFHKCTADQMKAWASSYSDKGIGEGATYSTGVRLDFYTNSSFFAFRVAAGSGTKFEIHINGEYVKTVTAEKNVALVEELDTSKGENRVTLLFPSYSKGALTSVQLSEGATMTPYKYSTKILFMGDSITHGHGTSFDSHSYAQLTAKHFDANSIIQGVGGGDFNSATIDSQLDVDPDYVIVSFGCNDWNRNKTNESGFRAKLTAYMDKLKATYPEATIIYITPIPRRDYDNVNKEYDMSLAEIRTIIAEEAAKRGAYSINGTDLLPDDAQYYSDVLHPNTKGHELYAENLSKVLGKYITKQS